MKRFPVVIEEEASGALSAYVPGHPVYAQADARSAVERAIQRTFDAYLQEHPEAKARGARAKRRKTT